jgi:hypothetical protein
MIEYILNALVGAGIGSVIAVLFYKIFFRKYVKLLNFANELAEKMENSGELENKQKESGNNLSSNFDNLEEKDEIDEINEEIRQLRKQIITTKDPRIYNFLLQKIKYLENRKKAIIRNAQYGLPSRNQTSMQNIDLSQIDISKLPNVDQLSDEELLALAKQFEPLIPRQFKQYARNPMLIRMFIKYILPALAPKNQEQKGPEQIQGPEQKGSKQIKGYTVV